MLQVLDWRAGIGTLVWWLCLLNLIGSVLFTVAAFLGLDYFDQSDSMMNRTVVWPYTIGSFMFAVASTIQIALWKRNLFGAGWMREAMEKQWTENQRHKPQVRPETTWLMSCILAVYSLGLVLVLIELTFVCLDAWSFDRVVTSLFGVCVMSAILSAGAIMHSHPPQKPYMLLFAFLHGTMLIYVAGKVSSIWHLASCCTINQDACLCDGMVYN
eukprot:TRINITY_DN4403_c0_g1_i5.p1 TRINITY_DN4403_c0_g1~~TRINITY_DN4403_c0_g1_i5.p1  ORF type:complete len:214 (-),score=29.29 TRINITY_DN4403_c0_g1_i5:172-813(-)